MAESNSRGGARTWLVTAIVCIAIFGGIVTLLPRAPSSPAGGPRLDGAYLGKDGPACRFLANRTVAYRDKSADPQRLLANGADGLKSAPYTLDGRSIAFLDYKGTLGTDDIKLTDKKNKPVVLRFTPVAFQDPPSLALPIGIAVGALLLLLIAPTAPATHPQLGQRLGSAPAAWAADLVPIPFAIGTAVALRFGLHVGTLDAAALALLAWSMIRLTARSRVLSVHERGLLEKGLGSRATWPFAELSAQPAANGALTVRTRQGTQIALIPRPHGLDKTVIEAVAAAIQAAQDEAELPPWSAGSLIFDEYRVETPLPKGRLGTVYRVTHVPSGRSLTARRVARDPAPRKALLAEAEAWSQLPEHPRLVRCLSFRSVGREVVIFTEFVGGGSLADHIRAQQQEGRIVDLATAIAEGLQFLHDRGLVHQDIKPANILFDEQGNPKLTDYGLMAAHTPETELDDSYHSPEQASALAAAQAAPARDQRLHLSRWTDQWSWGLTLAEMSLGERTWKSGAEAHEALREWLTSGPADITQVLRRALHPNAERRYPSMEMAAEALCGRPIACSFDGTTEAMRRVNDPRQWLSRASHIAGTTIPPTGDASDGVVLDTAIAALERAIASGRRDLELELDYAREARAVLYLAAGDDASALAMYARVIPSYERMLARDEGADTAGYLADMYQKCAQLANDPGRAQAQELCDKAIKLNELLIQGGRTERAWPLACCHVDKSVILFEFGRLSQSAASCERAIKLLEPLQDEPQAASMLARACACKARCESDPRAVSTLYQRAIELLERSVAQNPDAQEIHELAVCYNAMAQLSEKLGDFDAEVNYCDRAIALLQPRETELELLATAHVSRASSLAKLKDEQGAVAAADAAIVLLERLVAENNRGDLASKLGVLMLNKGTRIYAGGDPHASLALFEKTGAIWERVVRTDGQRQHAHYLAQTQAKTVKCLRDLGQEEKAAALHETYLQTKKEFGIFP